MISRTRTMKFGDLEPCTAFRWADTPKGPLNLRIEDGYMLLRNVHPIYTDDYLDSLNVIVVPLEKRPELVETTIKKLEGLCNRLRRLEDGLSRRLRERKPTEDTATHYRDLKPGAIFRLKSIPDGGLCLRTEDGYMILKDPFPVVTDSLPGNINLDSLDVTVIPLEECTELAETAVKELRSLRGRLADLIETLRQ